MYQTFEVENFRGLEHLELDQLSPVNILTGLNDAGKTSALEAIYLHAHGAVAGAQTLQVLRPSRGQQQLTIGGQPENPWESLFRNFDMSTPIRMKARTRSGAFNLTFEGPGSSQSSEAAGGRTVTDEGLVERVNSITIVERRGNNPSRRYTQILDAQVTNPTTIPPTISVNFKSDPQAREAFLPAWFVKPNLQMDLASGYSALRRRPSGVDFDEALRMVDDRIDHLEVLVSNGRPELNARVAGSLVPFQLLGDGPNLLAQYLIAMSNARGGVLLIDEVGSGVHYSVLEPMWNTLYRAATRMNVQIFATTHSAECVAAAAAVIRDHPNDLSVLRLNRTGDSGKTVVTAFNASRLKTALDFNAEVR